MSHHHKSQKTDNFFKGVKRKWFKEDDHRIRRNYENYYNREFITVRNGTTRPSIESLSVTQLVIDDSNTKLNPHKNTILSNWTTENI